MYNMNHHIKRTLMYNIMIKLLFNLKDQVGYETG